MNRLISIFVIFSVCLLSFTSFNNRGLLSIVDKSLCVVDYKSNDGSECVYLTNSLDDVIEIMDIEIVNEFNVGEHFIVEGYINTLSKCVCVDNRKINVQLSVVDDVILVGYPLIKNSF